jgi:hypothetical protein
MNFKLIQICNTQESAHLAQAAGIDRVMLDLEIKGKKKRQKKLDMVISNHTYKNIKDLRKILTTSELMVRINPLNNNSELEIKKVIDLGADRIMLPMFRHQNEVAQIINFINGQVPLTLLLETATALARLSNILEIKSLDDVHIGLNDLRIDLKLASTFEIFNTGLLDFAAKKLRKANVPFGIGGVSRLGHGEIPSQLILSEHKRLGSSRVIIARSFIKEKDKQIDFKNEIKKLRKYMSKKDLNLNKNHQKIVKIIKNSFLIK